MLFIWPRPEGNLEQGENFYQVGSKQKPINPASIVTFPQGNGYKQTQVQYQTQYHIHPQK